MGRISDAFKVLLTGTTAFTAVATPAAEPAPRPPMQINDSALAEASASYGGPLNPWQLPKPAPFHPTKAETPDAAMAFDRAMGGDYGVGDIYAWAANGAFSEGIGFLGYPYLAELSQRPEYRRVSEIYAQEATRKWVKFNGDEDRIGLIEKQLEKFNVRGLFRRACEIDGFFGRAQIYIDLGDDPNSRELSKPLVPAAKMKKGAIKNLKTIEPFWSYPGRYESTSPLHPDFYTPRNWFVMTSNVHSSRLLTLVGREMPDMLKPAYSFGGLSLSQMIKPYVDNWLRTRQSVSDLIHSFSTMVLATDMSTVLQNGTSAAGILGRLQLFNQTRDNRGVMAINKDSEELTNVSTPLGTLDALQDAAQAQIASVAGIPLVILLGVTPSGLNASSDGEVRTFYANIKAYQERVFRQPLQTLIDLLQMDLDGTIDEEISFDFVDLWEVSETDNARKFAKAMPKPMLLTSTQGLSTLTKSATASRRTRKAPISAWTCPPPPRRSKTRATALTIWGIRSINPSLRASVRSGIRLI
jgi:phage-related protein (TIGR01555 family)